LGASADSSPYPETGVRESDMAIVMHMIWNARGNVT